MLLLFLLLLPMPLSLLQRVFMDSTSTLVLWLHLANKLAPETNNATPCRKRYFCYYQIGDNND